MARFVVRPDPGSASQGVEKKAAGQEATPIQPLALPCRVGDSFYWFTNITNEKSKRGPPSGGSQLKTTIMGSRCGSV
jgi:hypothetical protein